VTTETEILDQVRKFVALTPHRLDMEHWHGNAPCSTAHCLAGWAQELSGEKGDPYEIGRRLLPKTAAMPGFFCSAKVARAWLDTRGYADDTKESAFRDALIGLGWKHVSSGTHETISGDWLYGNAVLTTMEAILFGDDSEATDGDREMSSIRKQPRASFRHDNVRIDRTYRGSFAGRTWTRCNETTPDIEARIAQLTDLAERGLPLVYHTEGNHARTQSAYRTTAFHRRQGDC